MPRRVGANDVDLAIAKAAYGGHEAIVRLCHDEWGASDVDKVMAEAAKGGHEVIMKLCYEWGAYHIWTKVAAQEVLVRFVPLRGHTLRLRRHTFKLN